MTGWLMSVMFRLLRLRPQWFRTARPARRAGICAAVVLGLGLMPGALAGGRLPESAGGTAVDETTGGAGPTILVLGDSISAGYGIQREQGWVSRLRDRVAGEGQPWHVVNASISGETTGGGLARLPNALEEHEPAVVIIELGGNDGLRGYPVGSIRDNLSRMVGLARDAGSRVLLVGMQIPPNYGPRYTRSFAAVFAEVAHDQDVPLVPFLLAAVALEPGLMQRDGIHPTAAAQGKLLDNVWPYLEPMLAETG